MKKQAPTNHKKIKTSAILIEQEYIDGLQPPYIDSKSKIDRPKTTIACMCIPVDIGEEEEENG